MLCGTQRKEAIPEHLSAIEKKEAQHELNFFLSDIDYSKFHTSVKKFAASANLNENHIIEISADIGTDPKNIISNKEHEAYYVFVIHPSKSE
jgi:hypothetical protein